MNSLPIVWLASYPRSGNTFLRTILWQCFGLRSGSIYPNDLAGNRRLEAYVGHLEQGPDRRIPFPPDALPLIKTHETPRDGNAAIYVVRDGRSATVSLWKFYQNSLSLRAAVEGHHRFGTWARHLEAWQPWARENTLLFKYEDLTRDLPRALHALRDFTGRDILRDSLPPREDIAAVDGRWVKPPSDWRSDLSGELLERFYEINGEMLRRMGYWT